MDTLVVHIPDTVRLTNEELFALCAANQELSIERDAQGNLIFMAPAGLGSSDRNAELVTEVKLWNRETKAGKVFESSGGFILPNGAMRAPDVSWIPLEKWEAVAPEEREKFVRLCPDFAIELRSRTDRLRDVQAKMEEYAANGCRLGWLIDPYERQAYVYRPGQEPEVVGFDRALSGEDVLPGFTLDLALVDTAAS